MRARVVVAEGPIHGMEPCSWGAGSGNRISTGATRQPAVVGRLVSVLVEAFPIERKDAQPLPRCRFIQSFQSFVDAD
jgi:hypothetical protein